MDQKALATAKFGALCTRYIETPPQREGGFTRVELIFCDGVIVRGAGRNGAEAFKAAMSR